MAKTAEANATTAIAFGGISLESLCLAIIFGSLGLDGCCVVLVSMNQWTGHWSHPTLLFILPIALGGIFRLYIARRALENHRYPASESINEASHLNRL